MAEEALEHISAGVDLAPYLFVPMGTDWHQEGIQGIKAGLQAAYTGARQVLKEGDNSVTAVRNIWEKHGPAGLFFLLALEAKNPTFTNPFSPEFRVSLPDCPLKLIDGKSAYSIPATVPPNAPIEYPVCQVSKSAAITIADGQVSFTTPRHLVISEETGDYLSVEYDRSFADWGDGWPAEPIFVPENLQRHFAVVWSPLRQDIEASEVVSFTIPAVSKCSSWTVQANTAWLRQGENRYLDLNIGDFQQIREKIVSAH